MNGIQKEADLRAAMKTAWEAYAEAEKKNAARIAEMTPFGEPEPDGRAVYRMTCGDAVMKYTKEIIGEPDADGYPLYICLHGGGSGETPDLNNQQWRHMRIYYRRAVENGICIAPRGVRDTYDCHSNPESYALYDELIENMILFEHADPNRVYLLGFSAGGDGVYQVSVKMADRFAAVNMSAGHPNGLNLENLCALPIALQCGENDAAYHRNTVTAEYGQKLDVLRKREASPACYRHTVFIHSGKPHNFVDYGAEEQTVLADPAGWLEGRTNETVAADTNAVHFVSQYTRNPIPERIVWNLATRAELRTTESFYWLNAPRTLTGGVIRASYDKAENRVALLPEGVSGDFSVLLNPDMADFSAPVAFVTPEGTAVLPIEPDERVIAETAAERGDPGFQFAARVRYSTILSAVKAGRT